MSADGRTRRGEATVLRLPSGSEPSSASEQVNDHDDEGNHEEEMDETAADVAEEAEKPEHEQDNNDSPEHDVPFD